MTEEYTVRLDTVFQGPMDLLLHLVKDQEVEIHEIEIAKVLDGYFAYLESLEELDIEFAGDFLVMAATLMAIKSRSLLPRDEVELDEDIDPRDELIQRLMEYKRFKEVSQRLEGLARERALLHERGWRGEAAEHREEPTLDLSEIDVWDLASNFARLMRETGGGGSHHVMVEARPLRFYVERMAHRVREAGAMTLRGLVAELDCEHERENLVGSFCALLELVKLGLVSVEQEAEEGEISVVLRAEHREDLDEVLRSSRLEDEEDEEDEAGADAELGPEAAANGAEASA